MCTVCLPYAMCISRYEVHGSRVFVALFFETLLFIWGSLNICRIKFSQPVFTFESHGSCTGKLQDIFMCRDIVKKKRDEHIKMVWRVSPAHKRLQTRMEHMRSFRRQHEQLRTVIMRVLRPTLLSVMSTRQIDQQSQLPGTPDQVEAGDMKSEVLGLEAADANAIEVNFG